jgi:hypothetical protein
LELRARTRRFPGQSSRPRLHPSIAARRASTRATVAVASSREGRLIVVSIARSTRRAAIDSIRFDSIRPLPVVVVVVVVAHLRHCIAIYSLGRSSLVARRSSLVGVANESRRREDGAPSAAPAPRGSR